MSDHDGSDEPVLVCETCDVEMSLHDSNTCSVCDAVTCSMCAHWEDVCDLCHADTCDGTDHECPCEEG